MNPKLHKSYLITIVTWTVRILTGALFIFSGFVKGIDVWGTLYKFEEYFSVWHIDVWHHLLLCGVFILCIYEFVIGVLLITGCLRRTSPILAMLFMAIMLPLTIWIAVADPISDCGCFGDAIHLSNWMTLWKNVVIVILLIWLIKFNTEARCLVRPSLQWLVIVTSAFYLLVISEIGYLYQPLIDFRKYPVGTDMTAELKEEENVDDEYSENIRFVYEKNGEQRSFSIDDELPSEENGWTFIRREEPADIRVIDKQGTDSNKEISFRVWNIEGDEDLTYEAIPSDNNMLMMVIPSLDNFSISSTWKINSIYSWAEKQGIGFEAVISASPEKIEEWSDLSLPSYPIYTAEDTEIKMLARGCPAIIYLRDGIIQWKSTLRALPDKDFLKEEVNASPESFKQDNSSILRNITLIYIIIMIALAFLSYTPGWIMSMYRNSFASKKSTDP